MWLSLSSCSSATSAYNHSGGCQTGSDSLPSTVRTPRGVTNLYLEFPNSSVVPFATAADALKTVSLPTSAQTWRSISETTMRNPLLFAAVARLRSHESESLRDLNL